MEGLVGDFPQLPLYREVLAEVLNRLCNVLNGSDRQAESERVAAQSLAIWEKLAAEHPEVPNYLRGVGDGLTYVAFGVTLPTAEPAPEPAAKVEEAKELPKSTPAPEAAKEEEPPK